ncbi:dihydrofolate reductase family protein [Dyadobacter fermentans]|uniref:Bifunctional deaminase-reductase domain protein n=1 Tax=Dyadobacter fermentans (strain ATCC 700827 / DSM 18053 / CIP 107007 / KCTC 52180 / NS114) TaxID=471854 RepID=C6W6Y6_DYAFD|nr:dihydrofolate reductase family protein [Dyadobacter fermentans]ACT92595.1 bifunctional deaminase-reductase domain protein [Dyadobacter fermentans DSM 18053]
MRKIILDLAVSLDGFIEGPNGEIDWITMDDSVGGGLVDFLSGIDAIFYGRVSYDLWGQYLPPAEVSETEKQLWEAVHSKEKYVFSHNAVGDGKATFINTDLAEHVREIRQRPGKGIWLYGGGSLITTFINLDLIDVYRLAIYPVILGEGKPVFDNIRHRVNLQLDQVKSSNNGITFLEYSRKRDV